MDAIDVKKVKSTWKKEGKGLKTPETLFAVYLDKIYFVIRDDSFIIFMIPRNCSVTYALPKKYCILEKDKSGEPYYKITQIENMSLVSCPGAKTPLERVILDNVIPDAKC